MSTYTLVSYYRFALEQLTKVYAPSEAEVLLKWVFEDELMMQKHQLEILNRNLSDSELTRLQDILKRLQQHEPIQYILGYAPFFTYRIRVNKHVLIPRPETEELVGLVTDYIKQSDIPNPVVLDIGTGSGCIPIAIKKAKPNAVVYAVDLSADALKVAHENALVLRADVTFALSDVLIDATFFDDVQFDIIVSNPPYIKNSESVLMESHVLQFEPHMALFVPDEDALVFYKRIAEIGKIRLKTGGRICVEINQQLGNETAEVFKHAGYHPVQVLKDMFGNERFVTAIRH